jgi:hypothetical protein
MATGPENQGDRKVRGSIPPPSANPERASRQGALRPVANRIEPSGFRFEYGPLRQPHSFNAGNVFGKDATVVRSDQGAPVIEGKCQPRGAASGL